MINHIVDRLTEYLLIDKKMELAEALKMVYQSKIYQQLQDEEGGLYASYPLKFFLSSHPPFSSDFRPTAMG